MTFLAFSVASAVAREDVARESSAVGTGFLAATAANAALGRLYWWLRGREVAAGFLGVAAIDLLLAILAVTT